MFKGTLFLTTDINMLQQLAYSSKIVIVGEPDSNMVQSLQAVVGSILLPPYSAMVAQLDNNMDEFFNQYYLHLYTKEAQEFITTIFKALHLGTNILLYCTNDEFKLCGQFLLHWLQKDFGVTVGTPNSPFAFDISYTPTICTLLYMNDLLTAEELFVLYPENATFNDMILPKLVNDLKPMVETQTKECYLAYFYGLLKRTKSIGKFRKPLIHLGV